jgi:hypothetical protein
MKGQERGQGKARQTTNKSVWWPRQNTTAALASKKGSYPLPLPGI